MTFFHITGLLYFVNLGPISFQRDFLNLVITKRSKSSAFAYYKIPLSMNKLAVIKQFTMFQIRACVINRVTFVLTKRF